MHFAAFLFASSAQAFSLSHPGIPSEGQVLQLDVSGAAPFGRVEYFISRSPIGAGPCAAPGQCLSVLPPFGRMHANADAAGAASVSVTVPSGLTGSAVCVQAATRIRGSWVLSDVDCFTILPRGSTVVIAPGSALWLTGVGMPYGDAAALCEDYGLWPLIIDDAAENAFVVATVSSFVGDLWVGIDDSVIEGSFFTWLGLPAPYFNWTAGEPNDAGDEDCVEMYPSGSWNDVDCGATNAVVCETR